MVVSKAVERVDDEGWQTAHRATTTKEPKDRSEEVPFHISCPSEVFCQPSHDYSPTNQSAEHDLQRQINEVAGENLAPESENMPLAHLQSLSHHSYLNSSNELCAITL